MTILNLLKNIYKVLSLAMLIISSFITILFQFYYLLIEPERFINSRNDHAGFCFVGEFCERAV